MKYNDKLNVIYDCITFGVLYFRKQDMDKLLVQDSNGLCLDSYEYFEKLKGTEIHIPKHLYPFFYYHDKILSPLSGYFQSCAEDTNLDFPAFLERIQDIEQFQGFIFNYILYGSDPSERCNTLCGQNIIELMQHLEKLPYDNRMKTYFVSYFDHFALFTRELIAYLQTIYPYILKMHRDNASLLAQKFAMLNTKESMQLLCKIWDISDTAFQQATGSVCLLNKYACRELSKKGVYMIGIAADQQITETYLYHHVSVRSFSLAMGDELRHMIVNKLNKPGESLTASQLSRILKISNSSIRRHIEVLLEEMILKIDKKEAREIYFTLNRDYFRNLKSKMSSYLDDCYINTH